MSSSVKALRHVLVNLAPVTALVPAERIFTGTVPQGAALPAIGLTVISEVGRHMVADTVEMKRARVQATVFARGYDTLSDILVALKQAPRSRGAQNTVPVDSILVDSEGPDFNDATAQIAMRSVDFIVNYTE